MAKHTEGPWKAAGRFIIALKQKVVCEIPQGGVRRGKVDDANAHLIAAAPTMKKALESIRKHLKEDDFLLESVLDKIASDALEAAEGRTAVKEVNNDR